MVRANFVKKARKDYPEHEIKKGEPYYWWKFNFSKVRHFSKVHLHPTRVQLTNPGFLQAVYVIEDRICELQFACTWYSIEGDIEDIISEIESLKDECEERLNNIPEALQELSSSGQMLQERIEGLENWVSELEGIDLSFESGEERNWETKVERFQEIVDGLSGCCYQG